MKDQLIRQALESHLASMEPPLPTIWQNRAEPPGFNASAAHQKVFMLPAENRARGLQEKTTLQSGIFQVNLCYPAGIGTYDVDTRAGALLEHFKGRVLEAGGIKVRIKGHPSIAGAVSLSPYVVPVTIRYESTN